MNGKLWRFAAALLPICFLSAQPPAPQNPQPPNFRHFPRPSPEVMRQIAEERQRMREHSIAINNLAGHIQSLDDARKLVDLVYAEFSHGLPPKWATRSIREHIALAEYGFAAEGALIPEQHIADAWNDYLRRIRAPQNSYVTATEIHTLRDTSYTSSQFFWGGLDEKQILVYPEHLRHRPRRQSRQRLPRPRGPRCSLGARQSARTPRRHARADQKRRTVLQRGQVPVQVARPGNSKGLCQLFRDAAQPHRTSRLPLHPRPRRTRLQPRHRRPAQRPLRGLTQKESLPASARSCSSAPPEG